MILYYKRPYIYIHERNKDKIVSPEEAIEIADCLYRDRIPFTYSEADPYGFSSSIFNGRRDCYLYNLPTLSYHFLDTKLCYVSDRQHAFHEIDLFMMVNRLLSRYTFVKQTEDEFHISLMDSRSKEACGYPVVEFVVTNKERPRIGYSISGREIKYKQNDILPVRLDCYCQKYMNTQKC